MSSPVPQHLALLLVPRAAKNDANPQTRVLAEHQRVLVDLHREFTRGGKNEGPRVAVPMTFSGWLAQQVIHGREQKRGGLAGPGLGLALHVMTVQRVRQGFRLDAGAEFEPRVVNPPQELRGHPQACEGNRCH